ncbi:uncharacterized protein [Montipora capricornis]|uniref:uncharacterized protein n=1 Tax=Montipora capricornis TaxID=246305 RepID=UPI0035F19690
MDSKIKYKSLLVKNEAANALVTVNFYPNWEVVCWVPHTSIIILPGDTFSLSREKGCKIELIARFKDNKRQKEVLLKPQLWAKDKLLRITDSLAVEMSGLSDEEKKRCLQKMNREKELDLLEGGCNLYGILRLNMKEVRAMKKEEQDEEITNAFKRELRIWHRDCHPEGDDDIAREVIIAYAILGNREKRATYNNMADYDSGWLSLRWFKAVFSPECETVEQRLAWIKRMALLALSVGLTIGGILSIVLTAGFSSPFLTCAVMGGLKALQTTISKEAVVDGCDVGKWLLSTGIGYLIAFLPGGAAIGVSAMEGSFISVAEVIGIRTAIASGCAIASSLTEDAKKKFVYGEEVTLKQAMGHAACQAAAAATGCLAGAAVSRFVPAVTQSSRTAATSIENAVEEKVLLLSDQAQGLGQKIPARLAGKASEMVLTEAAEFAEKHCVQEFVKNGRSGEDGVDMQSCLPPREHDEVLNPVDKCKPTDVGIVRYASQGYWFSKMVVSYVLEGEKKTLEKRGNGSVIKIPSTAEKIEVSFKVLRPPWVDIKKYDRFQGCWCNPIEPHIFYYGTPPTRTFTIGGPLGWESVIKITNERFHETKEM